jgi:hypothetical protein
MRDSKMHLIGNHLHLDWPPWWTTKRPRKGSKSSRRRRIRPRNGNACARFLVRGLANPSSFNVLMCVFNALSNLTNHQFIEKETPDGVKQFWKQNADEILACTIAYTSLLETVKGTLLSRLTSYLLRNTSLHSINTGLFYHFILLDTEKIKKTHEQEVSAILQTMKEIFDQLRTQLISKWKFREICMYYATMAIIFSLMRSS